MRVDSECSCPGNSASLMYQTSGMEKYPCDTLWPRLARHLFDLFSLTLGNTATLQSRAVRFGYVNQLWPNKDE